ncbi:MAG: hypothetical protein GY868_13450 [Deltaproteobacteria bacterium]|nr:hypothetical protein [Deltaproteobacteria bacterium]
MVLKKLFYMLISVTLFSCSAPARAVVVTLTDDMIAEAEAFGQTHSEDAGVLLSRQYSTGKADLFEDRIIVRTKWHKLALASAHKARKGAVCDASERKELLADAALQIDVILFGNRIDFANDFVVTLEQDGRTIKPLKQHADHFQVQRHKRESLSGFPSCRATLRAYFAYGSFAPDQPSSMHIQKLHSTHQVILDLKKFR